MAKSTSNFKKVIFEARYTPSLMFYKNLYNMDDIAAYFADWENLGIQMTYKDYRKHHSLTLKVDRMTFESDKFDSTEFFRVLELIKGAEGKLYNQNSFLRLGYRIQEVHPVAVKQEELVKLTRIALFNSDFIDSLSNSVTENQIIVIVNHPGNKMQCRLSIGPITKKEVPGFMPPNLKEHFYKSDNEDTNLNAMARAFLNYPSVGLYCDFDLFSNKHFKIDDFKDEATNFYQELQGKILKFILKET